MELELLWCGGTITIRMVPKWQPPLAALDQYFAPRKPQPLDSQPDSVIVLA